MKGEINLRADANPSSASAVAPTQEQLLRALQTDSDDGLQCVGRDARGAELHATAGRFPMGHQGTASAHHAREQISAGVL
eukprot:2187261-Pyramimonas_sp.AAC.1